METLSEITEALEHAPKDPGPHPETLAGWVTPAHVLVCARCAGRLIARGFLLPATWAPLWHTADDPLFTRCDCCGQELGA